MAKQKFGRNNKGGAMRAAMAAAAAAAEKRGDAALQFALEVALGK